MERRTRAQGDVFQDRYRIERLLGRGGFGTTYEAIDEHTGARVVLKEMALRDAGDWKSVERFEREARVLAGLNHPNIPRYVDHGALSGEQQGMFLVCELAAGLSLAQKVRSGWRPAEPEIVALARQVLDALAYLHGRSPPIVHRDVKPANLVVRDDGAVALVDFGAVRDVWSGDASRASTIVVGTFGYIAPEQYHGEASARSDLFALGCSLVFAMTGLAPNELPQRRLRLLFRSSAPVSQGLGRWLDRMIAPVAEDRFASAHDALRALDRVQTRPAVSWRWTEATAMLGLVVATVGSSLPGPFYGRPVPAVRGEDPFSNPTFPGYRTSTVWSL
jgi:eukaryotic-like serine/threonine-protein kinase